MTVRWRISVRLTRNMDPRVLSNFQHIQLPSLDGFPDTAQLRNLRVQIPDSSQEALHHGVVVVIKVRWGDTVDVVTWLPAKLCRFARIYWGYYLMMNEYVEWMFANMSECLQVCVNVCECEWIFVGKGTCVCRKVSLDVMVDIKAFLFTSQWNIKWIYI